MLEDGARIEVSAEPTNSSWDSTSGKASEKPNGQSMLTTMRQLHFFLGTSCSHTCMMLSGVAFAAGQGILCSLVFVDIGDAISVTGSFPVTETAERIYRPLKLFAGIAGGLLATSSLWRLILHYFAQQECINIQKLYLEDLSKMDIRWWETITQNNLPERAAGIFEGMKDALGLLLGQIVSCLGQLVSSLAFAITINPEGWRMTLILWAVGFFSLSMFGSWMSWARLYNTDKEANFDRAGKAARAILSRMPVVVNYRLHDMAMEEFGEHVTKAKYTGIKEALHVGTSMGLACGAFHLVYGLAFWLAAKHAWLGAENAPMAASKVFTSLVLLFSGIWGFCCAVDHMHKFGSLLSGVIQLFQEVHKKQVTESCRGSTAAEKAGAFGEVCFKAVSFNSRKHSCELMLCNISMTFECGQKIALVGSSSGAVAVLWLLGRHFDPDDGQITVNGRDLRSLELSSWRRQISYVSKTPVVFAGSVRMNINSWDSSVPEGRTIQAAQQAGAYDFIENLPEKLDTEICLPNQKKPKLSPFCKQQIAIARALAREPRILILDNLSSMNDPGEDIQALVDKILAEKSSNLTTISCSQQLSVIQNSDLIVVLREGHLAEAGSHTKLMTNKGAYHAIWTWQHEPGPCRGSVMSGSSLQGKALEEEDEATTTKIDAVWQLGFTFTQAVANSSFRKVSHVDSGLVQRDEEFAAKRSGEKSRFRTRSPVNRLFELSKPEWYLFPVAMLSCVLEGGAPPAVGYLLGCIMEVYMGGAEPEFSWWGGWWLALLATSVFGELIRWGLFAYIQEKLMLRLRLALFEGLLYSTFEFLDYPTNTPAALVKLLERSVKEVAHMTCSTFGSIVCAHSAMVVGVVMAFFGSWRLTLICLAAIPVCGLVLSAIESAVLGRGGLDARHSMLEDLKEAIDHCPVMHMMHGQQMLMDAFSARSQMLLKGSSWASIDTGLRYGIGWFTNLAIVAVGFGYGTWLMVEGVAPQSGVLQSTVCLATGFGVAAWASSLVPPQDQAMQSCSQVFGFLDNVKKVRKTAGELTMKCSLASGGTLQFDDVVFSYGISQELPLLNGLSFSVELGQYVAVMGPSTSCKTSVLQLLKNFYTPSRGAVTIDGTCLSLMNPIWWQERTALVDRKTLLFNRSLEENVKYGKPDASRAEVEAAAKKANMNSVFEGEIPWAANVGGLNLSEAEMRCCSVARVILQDPALLLLNEVTYGLANKEVAGVVKSIDAARVGRTTFTVSRHAKEVMNCDKILVIVGGTLGEEGTHAELMELNGVYKSIFDKKSK